MDSQYVAEHKVPTYIIRLLTNQDPEFYPTVGPFLGNREVAKELGSPVWDDPEKRWSVAVENETKQVIGLAAITGRTIGSFYVVPANRNKSVGAALLHHVLSHTALDGPVRSVATEASRNLFLMFGFKETGTKGRYYLMEKGLD